MTVEFCYSYKNYCFSFIRCWMQYYPFHVTAFSIFCLVAPRYWRTTFVLLPKPGAVTVRLIFPGHPITNDTVESIDDHHCRTGAMRLDLPGGLTGPGQVMHELTTREVLKYRSDERALTESAITTVKRSAYRFLTRLTVRTINRATGYVSATFVESNFNNVEEEKRPMSESVVELLNASSTQVELVLVDFKAVKKIKAERIPEVLWPTELVDYSNKP